MRKIAWIKMALITGVIALLPMSALASEQRGMGRPQGPPPEAVAACKEKSKGDSVEFKGRRGETVEATCQEKDGQLVAVPVNPPADRKNR